MKYNRKKGWLCLALMMLGMALFAGCGQDVADSSNNKSPGAVKQTQSHQAKGKKKKQKAQQNQKLQASGTKLPEAESTEAHSTEEDAVMGNTTEADQGKVYVTAYDQLKQKTGKKDGPLVLELDPGHGGIQTGAADASDTVAEKDVNLKLAQFLREELEAYEDIQVYLTRESDQTVELEDRVNQAVTDGADMLVSLHNNAEGDIAEYLTGCTVLVPRGVYMPEYSRIAQEAGCCVLKELEGIGIENRGLMFRICQNETTYPNGELCDYYAILRLALLADLPGMLIEHSFIDTEYDRFLSTDEKLREMARADARGLAAYFHLTKKGEVPRELKPFEATIMIVSTDYAKDNLYEQRTYFK